MRTLISSLALSILFLSAGAFAGNTVKNTVTVMKTSANVTVVHKNGASPVLPPALASCSLVTCVEI